MLSIQEVGIVFMTRCRDFAQEGYDAHPIHFLVKPIDRSRLLEAFKIDLKRKGLSQMITLNCGRKLILMM